MKQKVLANKVEGPLAFVFLFLLILNSSPRLSV